MKDQHFKQPVFVAQSLFQNLSELDKELPKIIETVRSSVVYIAGNNSVGSGIILTEDGTIMTNAHVISNNTQIQVELSDGSVYPAYTQYVDDFSDLALISINKTGLSPICLAEPKQVKKGNVVLAIGSPESFRESVTMGIVSGTKRSLNGIYPYRLIQTDAVVNHGNSGGPLINMNGEIIGIITFGLGMNQKIEVMNFAIPVSIIIYVLSHFYRYGEVKRPGLGAVILENDPRKPGNSQGALILEVLDYSPAQKAGLMQGDIIKKINGIPIYGNPIDIYEVLKNCLPDQQADIEIVRGGNPYHISLILEQFKKQEILKKTVCITKQII